MATSPSSPSPAPSLFDTCLQQLLSDDEQQQAAVGAQLENLPSPLLVQMVQSLAGRQRAAEAELASTKQQLTEAKEKLAHRYIVDPPFVMDRVGDEDPIAQRVEAVVGKWRPRSADRSTWTAHHSVNNYMNERKYLRYDRTTSAFSLLRSAAYYDIDHARYADLYQVISSALLMYRLACLFPVGIDTAEGTDRYKTVWEAEVEHVATGEALGVGEWKGAALVRVSNLRAGDPFESDMLELLSVLCAPDCPHPYDGTVAGTVA